jgi:hypothetical protein
LASVLLLIFLRKEFFLLFTVVTGLIRIFLDTFEVSLNIESLSGSSIDFLFEIFFSKGDFGACSWAV